VRALRRRLAPASQPGAEPYCRLVREDGWRRQAGTEESDGVRLRVLRASGGRGAT